MPVRIHLRRCLQLERTHPTIPLIGQGKATRLSLGSSAGQTSLDAIVRRCTPGTLWSLRFAGADYVQIHMDVALEKRLVIVEHAAGKAALEENRSRATQPACSGSIGSLK
jgi:hypothetical protein